MPGEEPTYYEKTNQEMREQELFGLIKQCEIQKSQIKNFMQDISYQYKHAVGSDRIRLKTQNIKYWKRKSILAVRIVRAKMQLILKGHNIEI